MKRKLPNSFTIIFGIIVIMAILTYIIPSGQFNMVENKISGKMVPVAGTYHKVARNPQGIMQILEAPLKGVENAADVVGFVLIIGGAFGILNATRAIEAGLLGTVKRLKGKELLIIPICMILFGIGGTVFGMSEETLPFYMIFIPLAIALGYDSITGFMIIFLGAAAGTASSTLNPFKIIIAQKIADVAPGSGVGYRSIQFVIFMTIAIAFVMWYASRVKADPKKSPMFELDKTSKEYFLGSMNKGEEIEFKTSHKLILVIFGLGIILIVWGITKKGWYMEELSMVFLGVGILAGVIGRLGQEKMAQSFIQGAMDLTAAALIIGFARGVRVIADDGNIMHTILYYSADALKNLPKGVFTTLLLAFNNIVAFFIPSSSGHATLVMSILAPLGDLVKVDRQVIVTSYQYGSGLTNMITPTSGVLMAALGIARIPWSKWAKFVLPVLGIFWITAAIFLAIGLQVYPV